MTVGLCDCVILGRPGHRPLRAQNGARAGAKRELWPRPLLMTPPPPGLLNNASAAGPAPPRLSARARGGRVKGKRLPVRLALLGSDVRVSTCKMAAHHRQNTAGRRKVQVGPAAGRGGRGGPPRGCGDG